eukprot:scaffold11411_cov63-Phaeocystis_antarctica.AAC.1
MGQARLTAASEIVRTGKSLLIGQGVNNSCSEVGPRVKGARGRGVWLGHWGCWAGASGSPRNGPSAERRGESTCVRRFLAADRACTPRESSSSTHGGDALRVPTHAEPHRYRGERSGGVAAPMWTSAAIIAYRRRALPRSRSRCKQEGRRCAAVSISRSSRACRARSPARGESPITAKVLHQTDRQDRWGRPQKNAGLKHAVPEIPRQKFSIVTRRDRGAWALCSSQAKSRAASKEHGVGGHRRPYRFRGIASEDDHASPRALEVAQHSGDDERPSLHRDRLAARGRPGRRGVGHVRPHS